MRSYQITDRDRYRMRAWLELGVEDVVAGMVFVAVGRNLNRIANDMGLLARVARRLWAELWSKFKAYDGINNIFNLAYEVLSWKIHRAIIKAKLEPYLGFLHSLQYGKPNLVCDLQELYRYLVDDFVIQFCKDIGTRDFTMKSDSVSRKRMGKREYLNDEETRHMMKEIDKYFESKVNIPLIRHGKRQKLETMINEDALLLTKYLRDEKTNWTPRVAMVH